MRKTPAQRRLNPLIGSTRQQVAYFANCKHQRFSAAQLPELSITVGHPLVAQSPYEGETVFQIKNSKPEKPRAVSIPRGTGPNTLIGRMVATMVVKGGGDDEGFLLTLKYRCTWSKFVPQLSRSSSQIGHIKHNMQRMHMLFVKLFRNC